MEKARPSIPAPKLQEVKKLVEDQRMAMEGLRKELVKVNTKSQAAEKRKMAGVPLPSKAELLRVPESDAKPQWVYAPLPACSTVLWRKEAPPHEYVSRTWDKEKFADVTLEDVARVVDSDAADTEVWCLESMDHDDIDRLKAFILAVWTFTVTSFPTYRGKRGLDPKLAVDQKEADDNEPSVPARSQGCTGAVEEEVVARRLAAMKAKFKVEGDRRPYTTKPGAEPVDVTCAPATACLASLFLVACTPSPRGGCACLSFWKFWVPSAESPPPRWG